LQVVAATAFQTEVLAEMDARRRLQRSAAADKAAAADEVHGFAAS
jgi:hypothetical protein